MRALVVLLAVLCGAPGTASAAPHDLRPAQAGTYAAAGRCASTDAPRIVLAGDRVTVVEGTSRRELYIESFCALNCAIEPPIDPRAEFSASLVARPSDRGRIADPFDMTALNINADGRPGVLTLTNDAPGTYQGRSRSALRHLYRKVFTRCPG